MAVILLLATLGDRSAQARRFTGSARLIVPGLELRLVGELIVVLTNVEEHSTARAVDHGGGVGGGGTFTLGLSF